jgi:hypothetical protein
MRHDETPCDSANGSGRPVLFCGAPLVQGAGLTELVLCSSGVSSRCCVAAAPFSEWFSLIDTCLVISPIAGWTVTTIQEEVKACEVGRRPASPVMRIWESLFPVG